MEETVLHILCSFIGTLGFSMYYNVGVRISALNAFCAMLGYASYVAVLELSGSIFWSNFAIAIFMTVLSELAARRFKVPTTMLLVPMLFPEIPGGDLYNMVWNLFIGETGLSLRYAIELMDIIAAMNLGIVLVTTVVKIYMNIRDRLRYGHYEGYR